MKHFVVYPWVKEKNRNKINMYKTTIFKHTIVNNRIVQGVSENMQQLITSIILLF